MASKKDLQIVIVGAGKSKFGLRLLGIVAWLFGIRLSVDSLGAPAFMNAYEYKQAAKSAAIAVLSLAEAGYNGGYFSQFGIVTYRNLKSLITFGNENYCAEYKHIKHEEMNKCIICHRDLQESDPIQGYRIEKNNLTN